MNGRMLKDFSLKNPRLLAAACLAIVLVMLGVGLWPFNFFPKNKVEWLPDQNGVHLYGHGTMASAGLWNTKRPTLFPDKSISLELWLQPLTETNSLPSILTLYDGELPQVFYVGQWKSHLIVRSRADDPTLRKRDRPYQELGLQNALLKDQPVFLSITSGARGSAVYMNGNLARTYPRHRLLSGYHDDPFRFVLGNTTTGQSYWQGNLLGLAVYSRVLAPEEVSKSYASWLQSDPGMMKQAKGLRGLYLFYEREGKMVHNVANPDDALTIPDIFEPVQRSFLTFPGWEFLRSNSASAMSDIAVNIAGFIPLGFFLSAYLLTRVRWKRWTVWVVTALVGLGLSLAIEILQAYLPTRDSSLIDVGCNLAGTILGILGAEVLSFWLSRRTVCSRRDRLPKTT